MALLLILASILALFFVSEAAQRERSHSARMYTESLEGLVDTGHVLAHLNGSLRGARGYLLTGDARFLAPHTLAMEKLPPLADQLVEQASENPEQLKLAKALRTSSLDLLQMIDSGVYNAQHGRMKETLAAMRTGQGREAMLKITDTIAQIDEIKRKGVENQEALAHTASLKALLVNRIAVAFSVVLLFFALRESLKVRRAQIAIMEKNLQLDLVARTDPLTGVLNRRGVFETLEHQLTHASKNAAPLAVALFDIDHFKSINDRHGHPAGDEVLRLVGDLLKSESRQRDFVGRIGGEEFLIVMPDTTSEQAKRAADRLCTMLARLPIPLDGNVTLRVTMSGGVSAFDNCRDVSSLVSRADSALYKAKAAGRNKVALAA